MKFTKSTPDTILPSGTWFICNRMGIRQPMRYERINGYIDETFEHWNTWWDLNGNCFLDSEDWAPIYFLNDLEYE